VRPPWTVHGGASDKTHNSHGPQTTGYAPTPGRCRAPESAGTPAIPPCLGPCTDRAARTHSTQEKSTGGARYQPQAPCRSRPCRRGARHGHVPHTCCAVSEQDRIFALPIHEPQAYYEPSSLSFRSCGCFGLAVSSSRSCRPRQPSCGGRRWMRTVRRCGRGSPTPVLLLCTQTHPAKDVGAASACAARADTVHRSCVLAHEVTLPRPCTRAGLNGDPDAWNSSSYDGYGTEYSGYNGFAVTGMETSEPTGGMRIRGWVRIRGWGVGCST